MNTRYDDVPHIPWKTIERVQFSIMSAEEITQHSCVRIDTSDLFDKGVPKGNGLYDLRMGTIDKHFLCQTCHGDLINCQGHFGHLELTEPMFNISFVKQVSKIVQCVCMRCSRLLITLDDARMYKTKRAHYMFRQVYEACRKVNVCPACEFVQPKWVFENLNLFYMFTEDDERQGLTAKQAFNILRKMDDATVEAMGFHPYFSHPKNMVWIVLPIPPPVMRPSVLMDTNSRTQDDLTHKLVEITKTNLNLKQATTEETRTELLSTLQFHLNTYIDNEIPGQPQATQRTGRPLKSVFQRIKSKEGRVRGNLMGKRVDFSARSVITAEPNIKLDELGVPLSIARNMFISETVTDLNKPFLQQCVQHGTDPGAHKVKGAFLVGAKFVVRGSTRKDLRFLPSFELQVGDVVERHLMDGDLVVFNRQPTLHKMSMMGHRVRVMSGDTFRLNLSATTPYNADFDGDEMNMHVPCSLEARSEVRELMMVPQNIVSPQSNKPVMGIVQDALLACKLFTSRNTFLTKEEVMQLLFKLNLHDRFATLRPCILKPVPRWSGKQLVDLIVPKHAFMRTRLFSGWHDEDRETPWCSQSDTEVYVDYQGTYLTGILCKKSVGASSNAFIHKAWLHDHPTTACDFISNIQFLVNEWLLSVGFSVGVQDCVNSPQVQAQVDHCIQSSLDSLRDHHEEPDINRILNFARDSSGKFINQQMNDANQLYNMVSSGSKGSVINLAQIMACVGQQNVNGARIQYGYKNRTLPHFQEHDIGYNSRGFVKHSYMQGLEPAEFFFHAMGGREGVIDTAIKSVTAVTEILLIESGCPKSVKIGPWVDDHLHRRASDVQHFPNDRNMEYLKLDVEVFIPTTDQYGHVSWAELTAVTRHDPGERIYKVTTQSGRSVTVAESESLLIWDPETREFHKKMTNEVVVGEAVPTVEYLPPAPITMTYVDMCQYFDPTEYIFGTQFHRAVDMMREAQGDRYQIPDGWWKQNNGTTFTLPYTKKASLTRVTSGRSAVHNIKPGFIYPYGARREVSSIPERFELNRRNGRFIGLYLADGNSDEKTGKVCISKNHEDVLEFVRNWFDEHGMKHKTYTRETNRVVEQTGKRLKGTTTSIQGYSTLLARFLHQFVGHGAAHKNVPDIAFTAPDDFALGLIEGYLTGDGHVPKTSSYVQVGSASHSMIEGFALLMSRFHVFGRITTTQLKSNNLGTESILPLHYLTINGVHASRLAKHIELFMDYKQERLHQLIDKYDHFHMDMENNMVVDPIVDIEVMDTNHTPKLYDVTVPSTLNFGLRNGIQSSDTSETGYCQRRLVKAMEDMKVGFDQVVRNSIGDIIQFAYGEDGFEGAYLISQRIQNTSLAYPVDLRLLIDSIEHAERDRESTEARVWVTQDPRFEDLMKTEVKNVLVERILRAELKSTRWTQGQLHTFVNTFETYLRRARVQPGEMVGTIAAQSLGQPITQMTLNTFHAAGISAKNVTLGVPRLKELLNLTKSLKSPSMVIPLRETASGEEQQLTGAYLSQFFTKYEPVYHLPLMEFEEEYSMWMNAVGESYEPFAPIDVSNWSMVLDVNVPMLVHHQLSLRFLTFFMNQEMDSVWCTGNHESSARPMVVVRWVSPSSEMENEEHFYLYIQKCLHTLLVKGIANITKSFLVDTSEGRCIETEGTDLESVLACPESVCTERVVTNDILEMYSCLGIEAARLALLKEMKQVIEFDGSYVNYRHLSLLVDTMTSKGVPVAITRHGINRADTGVLMRCSFEETVNIIVDAAVFAECDPLKGVTEHIVMGKQSTIGTGAVDVLMDWSKLMSQMTPEPIPPSSEPPVVEQPDAAQFRPSSPECT